MYRISSVCKGIVISNDTNVKMKVIFFHWFQFSLFQEFRIFGQKGEFSGDFIDMKSLLINSGTEQTTPFSKQQF